MINLFTSILQIDESIVKQYINCKNVIIALKCFISYETLLDLFSESFENKLTLNSQEDFKNNSLDHQIIAHYSERDSEARSDLNQDQASGLNSDDNDDDDEYDSDQSQESSGSYPELGVVNHLQQEYKYDGVLDYRDKHGNYHPEGFVQINDTDSCKIRELKEEYNTIHRDRVEQLNQMSWELQDINHDIRDPANSSPDRQRALEEEKNDILREQSEQLDAICFSKYDLETSVAKTLQDETNENNS